MTKTSSSSSSLDINRLPTESRRSTSDDMSTTFEYNATGISPFANNNTSLGCSGLGKEGHQLRWGMLGLSILIVATASGNILVCLAVSWERRLQNMTNYFLMSLAIADLLVSLLVMPLAMIVEMFGKFKVQTKYRLN